jgi:glycosyltransferase involved in cell wall biosynthesis
MVIPPEDPAALAEAVVLMATAPESRIALGIAGREVMESQYDRATLAARMLLTLSEAAGAHRTDLPRDR